MKLFYSRLKSTSVKNTELYRSSIIIGVTLSALCLTSCSDNNGNDAVVIQADSVTEVWFGEATKIDNEQDSVVVAVSCENAMCYPKDNMTRYGSTQASSTSVLLEGTATVSGSVIEFSATRIVSQDTTTLAYIAGNYSQSVSDYSYTRSIAIDINSLISGSDTSGCIYSSKFQIKVS